jgi:hypothetical protein
MEEVNCMSLTGEEGVNITMKEHYMIAQLYPKKSMTMTENITMI